MFIQAPQNIKKQGVYLSEEGQNILQQHFCSLILGPPQSGKSHLISQIVTKREFYGSRFDTVLFIGPSKYKGIQHDDTNTMTEFDVQILQNYIQKINNQNQYDDFNLLIVMDDVVADIKQSKNPFLKKLFFNRRHLINDGQKDRGTISIIMTSQKYTTIPTYIRSCFTNYFIFKANMTETCKILTQYCPSYLTKQVQQKITRLKKYQFVYYNINTNIFYNNKFENIFKIACKFTVPTRRQTSSQPSQIQFSQQFKQEQPSQLEEDFFKNKVVKTQEMMQKNKQKSGIDQEQSQDKS